MKDEKLNTLFFFLPFRNRKMQASKLSSRLFHLFLCKNDCVSNYVSLKVT